MADKMNVYEAISATMADVGAVGKESRNAQQGFMFRGIDAVMNALQPAMKKNGLFVVPEVLEQTREERTSKGGGLLIYSICKIKYTFYAMDGSSVSAVVVGEGMDSGDKATNKAMSIAFKYACFQVFCIPTAEMQDPDAESYEPRPKKKTAEPVKTEEEAVAELPINQAKINSIIRKCEDDGINPEIVCAKCGVKELSEITVGKFVWLTKNWTKEIRDGV